MSITYVQGMALLVEALAKHLDLDAVACIWRRTRSVPGATYPICSPRPNPIQDGYGSSGKPAQNGVRRQRFPDSCTQPDGIARYVDSNRSAWLPVNLIHAQRDYFGAHTYERIDAKGTFHTQQEKE